MENTEAVHLFKLLRRLSGRANNFVTHHVYVIAAGHEGVMDRAKRRSV